MIINHSVKSPNYDNRTGNNINYVIFHYTQLPLDQAITAYRDANSKLSAHYLISADGIIYNMVEETHKAWHAGKSYWRGVYGINEYSIGIELDNLGNQPFNKLQIDSLILLCLVLKNRYKIPAENFIGHSDIACTRKIDPGIYFPWQDLAKHNIGAWPTKYANSTNEIMFKYGDKSKEILILQSQLANIGYDVMLNGIFDNDLNFIIRAFKIKYLNKFLLNSHKIDDVHNDATRYNWLRCCQVILDQLVTYYNNLSY